MDVTDKLNLFPVKGGVSKYYSPKVILSQKPLDFEKHCKIPFGAYVQVNTENDPTNTPEMRMLDAIYLRPRSDLQEGHDVMDLNTGKKISRRQVVEIPITTNVI